MADTLYGRNTYMARSALKLFGAFLFVFIVTGKFCDTDLHADQSPVPTQDQRPKIRLGIILPLSGEFARFGVNARKAILLAQKQIRSSYQPQIIFEDNPSCGPKDALTAFKKLVEIDKVEVVATFCSGAAKSVAPLARALKLTHIQITETPDPDDTAMIKVMPSSRPWIEILGLEYAKRWKRVALLGNEMELNTGEGGNLSKIALSLEKHGSRAVSSDSFPDSQLDFRALINKLKASEAQAVAPFIYPAAQMAAFLRQADDLHLWDHKELAGNFVFEVMSEELFKLYPPLKKREGLLSVNFANTTSAKYVQDYQAEYGEAPPPFTDIAFDTYALVAACGSTIDCMLRDRDGASGELRFDSRRGRVGKHELRVLHEGSFVRAVTSKS